MRRAPELGWIVGASLLLGTLAGCASEPPFAIVRNQRAAAGTCELGASGAPITHGVFDVALGDRSAYLLTPLVRNDTDTSLTVRTVRVKTDYVNEGSWQRVRITCDLGAICEEWELSACNPADPSDCPVVPAGGTASFEVPILSRLVTAYFQGILDAAAIEGRRPPEFELRALITLVGTASDGSEVESAEFSYPLTLCLGCLVVFPPETDTSRLAGPDCCAPGPPPQSCQPGQDDPIDCRRCIYSAPEICNFGRFLCD